MPTTTADWKRTRIDPGCFESDAFIRPDGDYRISIDGVAQNIQTTRDDVLNFLESETLKKMIGTRGEHPLIYENELAVDTV
ncbi:MAG: hypothetical protein M3N42_00030, partial [Cyanobacteriota bacterium]|nr:hypothetical protein [Cyanobacteriota bacterium]